MIRFDPSLLTVETVKLKSATTALGGSIRILNPNKSTQNKEVFDKISAPVPVVRSFIQKHKTSKYLKSVDTAVVFYNGEVIALERHPFGGIVDAKEAERLRQEYEFNKDEDGNWVPLCKRNIQDLVIPLTSNDVWYFDGRYVYTLYGQTPEQIVHHEEYSEAMSSDGRFRGIQMLAIDLANADNREKMDPTERYGLAYVAGNGQFGLTPPIWKTFGRLQNLTDVDDGGSLYSFDCADEYWAVNLSFSLAAARVISEMFGFEAVEPLELPRLMLELRTVNLPKVNKNTRKMYDSGIRLTHALAWLIGLVEQTDTLADQGKIRALIKYLITTGIFHRHVMKSSNVVKKNASLSDVTMKTTEQAILYADTKYLG